MIEDFIVLLLAISQRLFVWYVMVICDLISIVTSFAAFPVVCFCEELLFSEVRSHMDPFRYCSDDRYFARDAIRTVVVFWLWLLTLPALCYLTVVATGLSWLRNRGMLALTHYDQAGTPIVGRLARWLRNYLASWSECYPSIPESDLRAKFHEVDLPKVTPTDRHTHGYVAAHRSAACVFARTLAAQFGLTVYSVERSKQDERKHVPGIRSIYWQKDLSQAAADDVMVDPLVTYVDVDYHVPDFEGRLANNFQPHLLYTMLPTAAGAADRDESFCFLEDGRISVRVAGGGSYTHHLWDYSGDSLVCTSWYFGMPVWTAVYKVEKRHLLPHRALVMLTPVARWFGYVGLLARVIYHGSTLQRFCPVEGNHVRIDVRNADRHYVSLSQVGQYTSQDIPISEFNTICVARSVTDPKYFNIHTACSWMKSTVTHDTRPAGAIVYSYLVDNPRRANVFVTKYEPAPAKEYTANTAGCVEEKPLLNSFMSPLDGNIYVPTNHPLTSTWAVKERVVELQSRQAEQIAPHAAEKLNDFVRYIAPDNVVLQPMEAESVWIKQDRPTQQRILAIAASEGHADAEFARIPTFVKKEVYPDPKDPRVISTVPGAAKLELSGLTMALTLYLKTFLWYAFTFPRVICQHIAHSAAGAAFGIEIDVSRMDGNTKRIPRTHVHIPVYMRLFRNFRNMVSLYFSAILHRTGVINGDQFYKTLLSVLSGGSGTSTDNTLNGVALSYLAMRFLGMDHEQATAALDKFMFGGDDAIGFFHSNYERDAVLKAYQAAGNVLGYPLKIRIVERGGFISFLGRYYCPWDGDTSSVSDIQRQVRKLHLTVGHPDPIQKAVEKAKAFVLTDRNTPILGAWATMVLEKHGAANADALADKDKWWAQFAPDDQFHNEPRDWYQRYLLETYPEFDMVKFEQGIAAGDPLTMPLCVREREPEPATYDTIVNGRDFVPGAKGPLSEPKQSENGKKRIKPETSAAPGTQPGTAGNTAAKPTKDRREPSSTAAKHDEKGQKSEGGQGAGAKPAKKKSKKAKQPAATTANAPASGLAPGPPAPNVSALPPVDGRAGAVGQLLSEGELRGLAPQAPHGTQA
jgi:hypothetical protein